ncbi:MAG: helix-hairpin-helix domain-containing protein [Candidatus Aenigmatarchaeota archaeon]
MEKDEFSKKKEKIKELMQVPSVGELTARALLSEGFGSLQELREVESEKLESIDHIGEDRAEKIYKELQGDGDEGKKIIEEFECPNCSNFISVDEDECGECGENVETKGGVVLPDQGILEEPKKKLAEVERDIWDDGDDPRPWFIRGSILESMGAKQRALDAYDKVIELDPLYEHIWNAKAAVCLKVGNVREAGKAYKVALDAHDSPMATMNVPETPSVEEKVSEEPLEESEESKEAERKISEARSSLEELVDEDLDLTNVRSMLDEATDARLDEKFEEAKEKAEKVIDECEKAQKFPDIIQEANNTLERLKGEEGVEYEKYEGSLEDIKSAAGEEDYRELVQRIQGLIEDMEEIKEREEKRKEILDEKIEEAKNVLREHRETVLELGSLKKTLRDAIKKKELEEEEKALEKLEGVIETGPIISEADETFEGIKSRLKAFVEAEEEDEKEIGVEERKELIEKFKQDLREALALSEEGDYEEVIRWLNNISYAFEEEKERLEKQKAEKEALEKRLSKVERSKEELSEEMEDLVGIDESLSSAEESLKNGQLGQGMKTLEEYVIHEDIISRISDRLEEVKEKKLELEGYEDVFEDFSMEEIGGRVEKGKEYCKKGMYEDAVVEFEETSNLIEEKIEEYSSRLEKNISDTVEEIEEMLEEGSAKEVEIFSESFVGDLEELKERAGETADKETLEELTDLKEKGTNLLEFKPKLSEVEGKVEVLSDEIDEDAWDEKLDEVEAEFEKGEYESALNRCDELKKELEEVEEKIEKEKKTENMDEMFSETKEKLANLRKSGLGLGKLKKRLRKANKAKKERDKEKAFEQIKKALEAGEELMEISELTEDVEGKLEELGDKEKLDAEAYGEELNIFRKSTRLGLYGVAKRLLSDLKADLEEGDFEREKIEEMDEPTTHLKEKIGGLKELHSTVEESGIEVQISKKHLKDAVAKIKEKEYEAVIDILSEGEEELLQRLEKELRAEVEALEEKDIGIGDWGEDWIKVFTDEIESRLDMGDHRRALKIFGEISDIVDSIEDKDSEIEKHLYSIEKRLEYVEETGLDISDERDLFEEAWESDELERVDSLIGRIREGLSESLDQKIDDEIDKVEERLLKEDLSHEDRAMLLGWLMKAQVGRKKENLEMMIFYWKKYSDGSKESD